METLQFDFFLASNSPRRRELLRLFGWVFVSRPAEVDESPLPDEPPQAYVLRLAECKARVVAEGAPEEALVLAADTTVVVDGTILGKPADSNQARAMLRQLRGRRHQVYTAIALVRRRDDLRLTDLGETDVPMREYTDDEIEAYVASGDPLDKAGAYAIQHAGFKPVERLDGCYANVMGLPLCHLARSLPRAGIPVSVDIPAACQGFLGYRCPVYSQILRGGG